MERPIFKIAVITVTADGVATKGYLSDYELDGYNSGAVNSFATYPEAEKELKLQLVKVSNGNAEWMPEELRATLIEGRCDCFLAIDKLIPVHV